MTASVSWHLKNSLMNHLDAFNIDFNIFFSCHVWYLNTIQHFHTGGCFHTGDSHHLILNSDIEFSSVCFEHGPVISCDGFSSNSSKYVIVASLNTQFFHHLLAFPFISKVGHLGYPVFFFRYKFLISVCNCWSLKNGRTRFFEKPVVWLQMVAVSHSLFAFQREFLFC